MEPFALFRPAGIMTDGSRVGALDADGAWVHLEWPPEWSREWEVPVKATFDTIFPEDLRRKVSLPGGDA